MNVLEEYYNKFYEERRLDTRHGQVEFVTSMKYIHEACGKANVSKHPNEMIKIMDIGAGTGRYSIPLSEEGYDVTAVELVQHNLGILKAKKSKVKAYKGNALNLSKFADDTYDVTLLFGPMYHLYTMEDKGKALSEAKRITKAGGLILVAYCMNEYGVITYAFKENHIKECIEQRRLDKSFHCSSTEKDLYDYVRVDDIERLANMTGLERYKLISADGPADYIRPVLNKLDEESFQYFLDYHLATCERRELLGAAAHTVDILIKI